MKAPILIIDDKKLTMKEPRAKVWRKLTQLKDKEQDIDTFAEIIATAFSADGITADDVLDNVTVSELIPLSFACISYVNELVDSKLEKIVPKNVAAE